MPRLIRHSCVVLVVLVGMLAGRLGAQAPKPKPLQAFVWVNSASSVYHCPGSVNYGKTKDGEYMSEAAARARGNRAVGGVACPRPTGPTIPPLPGNTSDVWLDTEAGRYYCPSTAAYARTSRGRFLSEVAARKAGFQAATGKRCGA